MKIPILDTSNTEKGSKELPRQFEEPIHPDLIARAVLTIQSNKRQQYGAFPLAGKLASAKLSRRRRDYKGSYGIGISRIPRKIMSHRGTRFNWQGAFAPGTVGGRRAHPPKAEKILQKAINEKENRKAIRSAIAATINTNLIKARNHIIPEKFPFIITEDFENTEKTKQVNEILKKIGFAKELKRCSDTKIRAGKGKMRGRKYISKRGALIVVSKECKLLKTAGNIPGIEVVIVNSLNAEMLAPGTIPGRLTLFTDAAIDKLNKENLFMAKRK